MRRKVIQIADSTQLISLPRKWAVQHNIKKGDELDIVEEGSRIIVAPASSGELFKRTEIDLAKLEPIIPRVLHALYKVGYDEVILRYQNQEIVAKIQKMLHDEMIGYEIVEQKPSYCVIRTIAGSYNSEYDTILRRTFLLLKTMLEGLVEVIESGNTTTVASLRFMESANNKYTGFCRRVINRNGLKSKLPNVHYILVEELEKIADQGKYICDYLLESKNNVVVDMETKELYKKILALFSGAYENYYAFDMKRLVELFIVRKEIINLALKKLRSKNVKHPQHLHYIVTVAQLIANVLSFELELKL
ncbi:MAG: AbrB/MazE/SpoVT family DNA-binding domain-containing protein [Candidatus Woesearchaeota archaeon]